MILQVPFEDFESTVKRVLKHQDAFVTARGASTLVTAASIDKQTIVVSLAAMPVVEATSLLATSELQVYDGAWHIEGLLDIEEQTATPYVAAVAYLSQEAAPGLWVDAYGSLPTQMTVLRAMYEEFRETGQVADVAFEEFVRLAQPTVVISTPEELHSFVEERKC